MRSDRIRASVKADSVFLLFRGNLLESQMKHAWVTRDELLVALRASGQAEVEQVHAVVL